MLWTAIAALALSAVLMLLLLQLRGCLLLPVRIGRRQTLTVTLRCAGDAADLERAVMALLWLRENGTLPASIVIEDGGMNEQTLRAARLLTEQDGRIRLKTKVEDSPWENRII